MKETSRHSKPFLYLVQSAGKLPELYNDLQSERSDVLSLTWRENLEGAIYFPKSSWTEGRNRLYEEAVKNPSYLYYIFLDDDVTFTQGNWRDFEDALLKYQPAIAVPRFPEFTSGTDFDSSHFKAQTRYAFDAIYNAFHRDVLLDGVILPYYGGFDKECWFYSQWLVVHLSNLFYPRHILQINTVSIQNGKHEAYPKNFHLERIAKWFKTEVLQSPGPLLQDVRDTLAPKISSSRLRRLIWRPRRPFPKLASYCTSPQQKQQVQLDFRDKQPELVLEAVPEPSTFGEAMA